jgi:hypothetical protein
VRAFAIDCNDEGVDDEEIAESRTRKIVEGVGKPGGSLEWTVAERSRRTARGDVMGRWCAWYTRPKIP